jgi:hypothetical protein
MTPSLPDLVKDWLKDQDYNSTRVNDITAVPWTPNKWSMRMGDNLVIITTSSKPGIYSDARRILDPADPDYFKNLDIFIKEVI